MGGGYQYRLDADSRTTHEPDAILARIQPMLFMVIERFKAGNPTAVGERFKARGRLMPDGLGISYVASWMTADGAACYQIMEAPARESLDGWIANWADLVNFEVVHVETSAEFWARPR